MCLAVSERHLTSFVGTSSLTAVHRPSVCMGSAVSTTEEQCAGCYGVGRSTITGPADGHRAIDPSAVSMASASTDGQSSGAGSGWRWSGPPGEHSPYPVDRVPYVGPQVLYCFVDIMTTYRIMRNDVNLGPAALTTDVEKHVHLIGECYDEGYTLDKFVRIPGVRMTTDVADWTGQQPYQAILTRLDNLTSDCEPNERWTLKVEKRILSTKTVSFNQLELDNDLLNTIHQYAAGGSRLVCAEPVGCVKSLSPNEQYRIMGVELFFNFPLQLSKSRYTYHTVTVAAQYQIVSDATQTVQQVECNADFLGQLKIFLNTGWKLVDICIDTAAIAEAYKMRATSKLVETIWIFEKETNRLFDDTPLYEGVIIEYLHRVKISPGKYEKPCRDWRPVIAGMGITGWRLATIIQTPLLVQSSFTTYTMKLLFIFQRRISHRQQQRSHPNSRLHQQQQQQQSASLWTQRQPTTMTLPRLGSAGVEVENGGASVELANEAAVSAKSSTTPVGVRVTNATIRRCTLSNSQHADSVPNGGPYDELYRRFPAATTVSNGRSAIQNATMDCQVRERRLADVEGQRNVKVDRGNGSSLGGTTEKIDRNGGQKTDRIGTAHVESTIADELGGTGRTVHRHRNSVAGGRDHNHRHRHVGGDSYDQGHPK